MELDVSTVDLAELVTELDERVPVGAREGFVVGRTSFRDAVQAHLGCSELEAERLVDTMVSRGMLRFREARPDRPGQWSLGPG
jgi:myo-inositol catabolism protein IolC